MEKETTKSIKKIVLLGAESTGKSTLCVQLAKHYNTVFVPEYARTYFETHDINSYSVNDLLIITKQQLELEHELIQKANHFLFCDTSLITIKIWAKNQFDSVPNFVVNSIKATDYDLYLLCNNDVTWVSDKQRVHPEIRTDIFNWNKKELESLGVNYSIIEGIGEERLASAIALIDDYLKAKNPI